MAKKAPCKAIKDHWNRVSELGCLITGQPFPTIHHTHGGSLKDAGIHVGMAQKQNDYLVIPLAAEFHTGNHGIDNGMGRYKGVRAWEIAFGTQLSMLDKVCELLGYDVWKLADIDREELKI